MRVLIAIQPGTGHFNPIAPLARAVLSGGHEVLFAAAASFCPRIQEEGFEASAAGIDFLEESFTDAFPELADMPPEAWALHILKTIWLDRAARAMLPDLNHLIDSWHPDILLHDYWEFATPLIAEKRGLPHAVIAMSPHMPPALLTMMFSRQLDELTQEAELEPDPNFQNPYRFLYLDLYPPSLQEVSPDSLGVARHFRPWDVNHDQAAPDWLEEMTERPLVYVSMGTVFNDAPELFESILSALRDEDVDVLVSLGSSISRVKLPAFPNARVESFVPQRAVLDRTSVFITHAGFSSLLESLAAAVPMLCIPLSAEQPFNAANAERLGAALVLSRTAASPENLREAVRRLLQDPSFREKSRLLKAELESLPGIEDAVPLIEHVANTREPVSNHPM